jgi:hypothetical protein
MASVVGALALLVVPATAFGSIRLGAYTPYAPAEGKVLDEYAQMVGRKPDIVMFYRDFVVPLMTDQQVANLKARGEVPMITWEPDQPGSGFPVANLADIASGKYDNYIRQAAQRAKEYSSEVMIRFAHEMNISASPWGPGKEGNVGSTYVEAWRHIVSIFRQEGATNVKWVWSPNVDWGGVPFAQYFPGDSWVDYVALDGYNWGTVGTEAWQSMSRLFASSYATLTQMSSKPVIFAETSSGETGGSKAAWIREGFLKTIPEDFPRVDAVIWFNAVAEEDWRINTSPSALEAYREVVNSTLYGGTVPPPSPPTETGSEVQSVTVTPSPTPSPSPSGKKHPTKQRRLIVYRVSRKAPVKLTLQRLRGGSAHRAFELDVNTPSRRGSVAVSRLMGGRTPSPGAYLVTASVAGPAAGASRPRRTRFEIPAAGGRRQAIGLARSVS